MNGTLWKTCLALALFGANGWGENQMNPKSFVYKEVEGLPIELDVYRKEGSTHQPVIVWIHGGALIGGNRGGIKKEQLNLYLDSGYTVVSIDYRLAPETKIPGIVSDVRDALLWVREKGAEKIGVDPDRMGVIGHSAGGYLTLMSGTLVDPPPKALVSFYGYGNIVGDWYSKPDPFYSQQPSVGREEALASVGTTPIATDKNASKPNNRSRFYLYCRQQGLWPELVGGVSPDRDPDFFSPYCPVKNVSTDYPPTLLIHGDKDTDVPVDQSLEMAEALEKAGVPFEKMILEERGHGFDGKGIEKDEKVAEVFDRVIAFLNERL